jgi:hypothetical protein
MARTSKTLKAITTEAKAIRNNKPSLTWQQAIKQASKFYNDTVKPTAKKVAVKTKKVAKAAKKGYDTALLEYKKNTIGKASAKKVSKTRSTVKTGSSKIGIALTKKKIKNIPTLQKFIKTGVPANKGAKPKKPSLTDLKKANIEFFEGYRKLGVKEQKVFYSPILNKYFLIQKIDASKFKNNNTMLYKNIQYYAFIINPKSNKVASMPDYVSRTIQQINAKFLTQIID